MLLIMFCCHCSLITKQHSTKNAMTKAKMWYGKMPSGPVIHPVHSYHMLFMPRLPTSMWVLGLLAATSNLSVYANLRIVQTHLSLPQQSN